MADAQTTAPAVAIGRLLGPICADPSGTHQYRGVRISHRAARALTGVRKLTPAQLR
jgi:hypothetical protein